MSRYYVCLSWRWLSPPSVRRPEELSQMIGREAGIGLAVVDYLMITYWTLLNIVNHTCSADSFFFLILSPYIRTNIKTSHKTANTTSCVRVRHRLIINSFHSCTANHASSLLIVIHSITAIGFPLLPCYYETCETGEFLA